MTPYNIEYQVWNHAYRTAGPEVVGRVRTTSTVLLNNSAFLTASMVLLVPWDSMGDSRCVCTTRPRHCALC